jgi:hypothetical protein
MTACVQLVCTSTRRFLSYAPRDQLAAWLQNRVLPNNFPGKLHILYIRRPGKPSETLLKSRGIPVKKFDGNLTCSGFPTVSRDVLYRGFIRKGARVRIITFRVTTKLQSKSNRCILHTTLVIWLLTRPGSSNSSKFLYWLVLNSFTQQNWYKCRYLLLTMGVTIQNLFVWGFFKFVWWRASEQYFHDRDHCTTPPLRSDMDPNVPQCLLRP